MIYAHKIYIFTVYNNRIAPLDRNGRNATGRACGTYTEEVKSLQDISGKPEEKKPPGISKSRWKDNIKNGP